VVILARLDTDFRPGGIVDKAHALGADRYA
jgi:hypothetical protein